jgi:hypothetical protein
MSETDLTERIKTVLTVMDLATKTYLTSEQRKEVMRICNLYLGSLLNHG